MDPINIDRINIDLPLDGCSTGQMTTMITASEAAHRLGVRPATLYAYVSRGKVTRVLGVDGRRSLFAADAIDALAEAGRRAAVTRPSLVPLQIDTAVTELGESTLRFRGHDATELATTATFEQVAELLWTGQLGDDIAPWPPLDGVHPHALAAAQAVGGSVFSRLSAAMLAAGRLVDGGDALISARLLVGCAPSALGAPVDGPMARRVASIWSKDADRPMVNAVERVLILLADHELATCTFAARVAASTRTELAGCLVAGLSALSGPLHGGAARSVHHMMLDAEATDGADVIAGYRSRREPAPGFGHKVYKSGDPRVVPILDAVRALDGDRDRTAVVDYVLQQAAERLPVAPNVDFALGALSYVADLPADAASVMFSIARLAGITAHVLEEYEAPPLRFRTTARYTPSSVASDS
jgi:citrate synthase